MENGFIIVALFAVSIIAVVGVVIYNLLRGVHTTREAMLGYFGVILAVVILTMLFVFGTRFLG